MARRGAEGAREGAGRAMQDIGNLLMSNAFQTMRQERKLKWASDEAQKDRDSAEKQAEAKGRGKGDPRKNFMTLSVKDPNTDKDVQVLVNLTDMSMWTPSPDGQLTRYGQGDIRLLDPLKIQSLKDASKSKASEYFDGKSFSAEGKEQFGVTDAKGQPWTPSTLSSHLSKMGYKMAVEQGLDPFGSPEDAEKRFRNWNIWMKPGKEGFKEQSVGLGDVLSGVADDFTAGLPENPKTPQVFQGKGLATTTTSGGLLGGDKEKTDPYGILRTDQR